MMVNVSIAFLISFVCTLLAVRSAHLHVRFSADWDLKGVQKNHVHPVPRVGGIGIFLGTLSVAIGLVLRDDSNLTVEAFLTITAGSIAFLAGLVEDFTKRVSPSKRLIAAMLSALVACWTLKSWIIRVDLPFIDQYLAIPVIAIAFTAIAVAGLVNAINIIDGFNGLASMVALMMFISIAYVGFQVNDYLVLTIAFALIGSILGFFIWNFPAGLIFLGDGGAYFLGFMLAELSILLVARHPQVSAWYPVLMFIYPIFETLFSIYRRRFVRGVPVGYPDGVHLHTLIYKRLIRWAIGSKDKKHLLRRNSMTSPYLWLLSLIAVIPATLFWKRPAILLTVIVIFMALYVWLYWRIVRFKSPRWMILEKRKSSKQKKAEEWKL